MSRYIFEKYAKALLDLAQEAKAVVKVDSALSALVEYADKDLRTFKFFASPVINFAEKAKVVQNLAKKFKFPPVLTNFLLVMAKNHRLGSIAELYQVFTKLTREHNGEVLVEIASAQKLTKEVEGELKSHLAKATGKKPILKTEIKPELINGLTIKLNSILIDSSWASSLQELQNNVLNKVSYLNSLSKVST